MSDNTGAVTRFYDQVRQGDIPSATEIFADELTWVEPPFPGHSGGTFRGKATILEQVLGPFVSTWSDLTVTPDRVIDGGADVVVLGRYAGKHKDTGRPFEARCLRTRSNSTGRFDPTGRVRCRSSARRSRLMVSRSSTERPARWVPRLFFCFMVSRHRRTCSGI
jgi:ketosteroid isomerase-like protein